MSKRARLFVVFLVLVIGGVFIFPSLNWYFFVPQEKKELAAGTREQIRQYARGRAVRDLEQLKSLADAESKAEIPEELSFLLDIAKSNYRLEKRTFPKTWNAVSVMSSFQSENEAFDEIETYYREDLLELKERSNNILQLGLDLSGGMSILIQADEDSLQERLGREPTADDFSQAIDRAMEIMTNRIDKFGVTEPQLRRQGIDQIAIEIPGAADPERVYAFLKGKGSLNFHIVDQEMSEQVNEYFKEHPADAFTEEGVIKRLDFVEAGFIIRGFYEKDKYGIDILQRYVVIVEEPGLDGSHINNATVGNHPLTGKPVINFEMDSEGGDIFFQLTTAHEKETLAIVLDDKVKAMAGISEPIRSRVQMSGFDRTEANELALVLRTAAMPVDLKVNSQQAVGASLGEDSVREGLNAILLGFILVMVFMFLYYKGAGLVADLALVMNLGIMVSILSAFHLTLTLTSIAGIILTVGMAVDANVIIFERIKEEYRLGKTPQASAKAGFKKAFWTIMDANITTFIAALVLSQIGSGPVQGFANTLAVGIVSSMFTALFVSRLIFDFTIDVLRVKKLSISWRL